MSTISTRGPTNSKLQLGGASRLRSSSSKKLPEPLRRAVADSLSSSALSQLGGAGAGGGAGVSEPSRTLRDYLAAQATIDLAYCVILEHTLAEKERSPAVVARCVALLKRYLLRYKPSEETLQQIDRFCVNIIAECDVSPSRWSSPWLQPSNQQSGASTTTITTTNMSPPLPVLSFASGALVKSLNYVRSLVAQHMPKQSFQPAAFTGAHPASRKSLPSLSSLLSRSFNSQLKPANNKEPSQNREASTLAVSNSPIAEEVDGMDELEFIAVDVLNWRWCRDQQSSLLSTDSDSVPNLQDTSTYNFLEVGAAALLVGDVEANMKGQPWRNFGTADMPYLDQLLQPSLLTTVTSSASARAHLRAITATKRTKPSPNQIWKDSSLSTFRPRARPLFQYRHYSEQQPLRLSPAEVCEVIAAVCSETPPNATIMTVSSKLSNNSGKPSMDVAVSVLIKLVIDMYVLDSGTAAPLTLSMLKEMLSSPRLASRCRAFDLILNLGVHGHLLEPMILEDTNSIEEDYSQDSYFDSEAHIANEAKRKSNYSKVENLSAVNNFESWILGILCEILLHLVQIQEREESVWASALSCLLYFVCHQGKIRRSRLEGLDIRVVKVVIEISRRYTWAEVVRSKLICMFTNMFYQVSDINVSSTPKFLVEQIDLIGGIDFIFLELLLSNSREERRNLYLVLFDYVLHLINEIFTATGVSEFREDEIQPIAALLMLADAPEAFYISIKLGVEGIGELLRKSVSAALSTYPNSDRLNTLLEKITEKIDTFIRSFIHLDREFTQVIQITKSYKSMKSIEGGVLGHAVGTKVKLSWASLHSLLHSERLVCRHNGYVWLGDLLIAEISEKKDANIWSNIRNLQQKIAFAGANDYSVDSDVPLPVWLLCGLLKSKNVIIRWGFLFVLERLLMRCKFLLDENELQHSSSSEAAGDNCRLDKANAVIDIMSSALALVTNETDRVNILKMCDILFSQLCLNVLPATTSFRDTLHDSKVFGRMCGNKRTDAEELHPQPENFSWEESMDDTKSRYSHNDDTPICKTASMAALLLRGQAIVPMQLVARVPVTLFHWPLIQLAGEVTDNIALGVSVGSKGRGYLPGATSDIRATLLLLLIGKCTADPVAFQDIGGEEFFRMLLDDTDSRVAYYSSTFLLKRMMTEEPETYQRMLQSLIFRAQQSNNEKLLENPYLQMRGILHLSNQ